MRTELGRPVDRGAHQLLAAAVRLLVGVHDDQYEPRGDVLAEALDLHDRRAALVAEDLVRVAGIAHAEAEVIELAGSEPLLGHRRRAQRGERIRRHELRLTGQTVARCSCRCSSRNAR